VCLPLRKNDLVVGVLVLGLMRGGDDPQVSRPALLGGLCSEIAAAIQFHQKRLQLADIGGDDEDVMQLKIREAVHEASNPLSIIRNYLELLRVKLGDEHQAHGDLDLIKQEIDRVGTILLRLREPESAPAGDGEIALNKLVADIARIFETSLCTTHQINLRVELAESLPPLSTNSTHIQQILTNLLKNAVEALPPGGTIRLVTQSDVVVNGRNFAAITVADNGPGLPTSVLKHLFSPVVSTKGGAHSGLGLSITKKLIDEIGGSIMCKSNKAGTEFQLLIPSP
jgi:nitrogen-specific signal transduction histidine kinase